jgi:uncharacterized membrane-anchored protein YhcB (DUF1043 family)
MIEDSLDKQVNKYIKMYQNLEVHMDDTKENITSENTWSSVFLGSLKETSDNNNNDKSALGSS